MDKQRIYVHVVGFSDVERHALNTVFRLSEERELAYAPWAPLSAPGVQPSNFLAEVILVDGASAEAVPERLARWTSNTSLKGRGRL